MGIITSTKIDISKVDTTKIKDYFFNRYKRPSNWDKKSKKEQAKLKELRLKRLGGMPKQKMQFHVDNAILEELNGETMMKHWLSQYWTIVKGHPPHAIKF